MIDAEKFRLELKKKAKTIQSPMGSGFIPPTEEELKGGFDDGEILYNG